MNRSIKPPRCTQTLQSASLREGGGPQSPIVSAFVVPAWMMLPAGIEQEVTEDPKEETRSMKRISSGTTLRRRAIDELDTDFLATLEELEDRTSTRLNSS